MDLIIELIVWLFKALAGDKDKAGKSKLSGPPPTQRGPYNYGDGRPTTSRPKTLEEILEEVRRQQAQAKQGGARPPNAPAARPANIPPPPREDQPELTAKQRRRLKRAQLEMERAASQQAAAPSAPATPVPSTIETRTLRSKMEARDSAALERERAYEKIAERADTLGRGIVQSKAVAEVTGVKTMGEVQTIGAMEGGLADKKMNMYNELFKALRIAPPQARREMARNAFVFSEVLGPPRSKRALRRR